MMEFRKVGRGGAGNFYMKQEVEAAAQYSASKQAQAQRNKSRNTSSTPPSTRKSSTSSRSSVPETLQYATSGRGGAGNLVNKSSLPAVTSPSAATSTSTQEADQSNSQTGGLYGRGGAGNFYDSSAKRNTEQAGKGKTAAALPKTGHWSEADVDLEAGNAIQLEPMNRPAKSLKRPEKAHLGKTKLGSAAELDTP